MMALVVAPRGQRGTSLLSAHPQIHHSKVWFTVAQGITSEVFYPRLDVPNMQDMQYVVTDGSTFVDLERDATKHAISMPDEKALELYRHQHGRSRNTQVSDHQYLHHRPAPDTLLIRTRFQSLDGGIYRPLPTREPMIGWRRRQ